MFVHVPAEEYRRLKHLEASAMNAFTMIIDLLAGEKTHGRIIWDNSLSGALMVTTMAELGYALGFGENGEIKLRHVV